MHLRWTKRIVALSFAALHVAAVHGQPREQVVIDGARAVMPLAMALAKEFEIRVRDVGFVFETDLGSEARLEAVIQGKLDIAVATNSLDLAYVSREGMAAHQIARTAVVFAVNSGVPVSNLTRRQICDVYNGLVSNWNSLGGPDLAIAPHSPPGNQVDAQIVRAAIQCLRGLRRTEAVKVIGQPRGMAKALARSLAIDGVAPSADNVESRRYRMIRQTFFVTWSPPSPAVGRFLRFVRSSEGDKLIRVNGAVPAK